MIEDRQYRWYALHTSSRAEKRVYAELLEKKIEAYLPLIKKLKQWTDRKKWIEEPLIRSYIFVRVNRTDYRKALDIPMIARYVTFEGKAPVIPDEQIESLKILLASNEELEVTTQQFKPGDNVEVRTGPLARMKGELVEYHGSKKVRVRIDHTGYSILVTISPSHLAFINAPNYRPVENS